MAARISNFWDFKSYDEKSWFRDLVCAISILGVIYIGLHWWLNDKSYNYEYNKLNQDQTQFVSRLYMGAVTPVPSVAVVVSATSPPATGTPAPALTAAQITAAQAAAAQATTAANTVATEATTKRVMDYLEHVFDGEIDPSQKKEINLFLAGAKAQDAITYLGNKQFKVHSFFWLTGPAVYLEVIFCALFGVFCNLLFVLGNVGSNSTTDLANPATQFDSSEILGQVAKIIYAPICTLFVVLGYSLIKGQNIVDVDLGKGLLMFGFVGGYYSSRVIALMDRLKDVLLPNSGTAALPTGSQPVVIPAVKVALSVNPVPAAKATLASGPVLNTTVVQIALSGGGTPLTGNHAVGDPDGMFTFTNVTQGNYTITATLSVTPAGGAGPVLFNGSMTGQILSGTAPIPVQIS